MALIKCPDCGKEISDQAPACIHCGAPIASPPLVAGVNIANILGLARTADLAGNAQEAEKYYAQVLEADPTIAEAWFGKGKSACWQSSIANMRIADMLVSFGHAIATSPPESKEAMRNKCVDEANTIIVTLYGMAHKHMLEYVSLPNTWSSYLEQVSQMLTALEEISGWNPSNIIVLENIVHLCKDNIEGVSYRDEYDNNIPKVSYLTPEYESLIREKLNRAAEKIKEINPQYLPPQPQAKKPDSSCFVVTATMGDPHHPTVILLRAFRDQRLIQTKTGAIFVKKYYKYGPKVARIIKISKTLRMLSLFLIVKPAAWIAQKIMRT